MSYNYNGFIKEEHLQGIYTKYLESVSEVIRKSAVERKKLNNDKAYNIVEDVMDHHNLSCIGALLRFQKNGKPITIFKFSEYSCFNEYGYNFFNYVIGKDYTAKSINAERKYRDCLNDPLASPYKALHYKNKAKDYRELELKCKMIGRILLNISDCEYYMNSFQEDFNG